MNSLHWHPAFISQRLHPTIVWRLVTSSTIVYALGLETRTGSWSLHIDSGILEGQDEIHISP